MIISSGIQYRNFAAQNEFAFYFDAINSSSSGISEVGFSGSNSSLPIFLFKSGSIFDFNNKYVWSYNPREVISISGNIGSGYINYFINQTPICLFSEKPGGIYYDNFYFKTTGSEIEYNFYIQGDVPNYNIIFPKSGFFGQKLTGVIKNTEPLLEKSFKIFSGSLFNENTDYSVQSLPLFVISGNQSGEIILRSDFDDEINISEILTSKATLFLHTNFGNIQHPVLFDIIPGPIYFNELFTGYTGGTGLIDNFTFGNYYNYELRSIYPEIQEVNIFVKNISGHTGQIVYGQFEASGQASGLLSGFIYGFDYITGTLTGTGIDLFQKDYYGNNPTGSFSINFSQFQYATGNINYNYSLPLLGASGTGNSPLGTIIPASGLLVQGLTGFVFGFGIFSNQRNINLTGYYFDSINIKTGIQDLNSSGFFTGFSVLDYRRLLWKSNDITGNGYNGFYDKIYLETGSSTLLFNTSDSGVLNIQDIYLDRTTGVALKPILNQNENYLYISGSPFASENNNLSKNAFTGDNYFYLTGNTGEIGIFLINYPTDSKSKVSYYSFELDFNTLRYPLNFNLELSTDRASWIRIDSRTGNGLFLRGDPLNFYDYPKSIVLKCNEADKLINNNHTYQYARLNIISTANWLHNFTGIKNSSGFGIKNIELYTGIPIGLRDLELFSKYDVAPNLTGYSEPSGGIYNNNSFAGNVIYSNDSVSYPAWQAFNSNKNLYPYAEISGDINNDLYIGYSITGTTFDFTGFNIEFENNFIPTGLVLQFSRNGTFYTTIYENYQNTGNLNLDFIKITGCKSLRVIFNKVVVSSSSTSCVSVPSYIDINNPCYQGVIDNDPFCCETSWDSACDNAYFECAGEPSSSSSSSSVLELLNNANLWIDPQDINNILFEFELSSSSSSTILTSSSSSDLPALSFDSNIWIDPDDSNIFLEPTQNSSSSS